MKIEFLLLGFFVSLLVIPAHAQVTSEFGYQLHPEKFLENTEGTLQIFVTSNDLMIPKQINGLKATSSDNSIIEILRVEDGNDKFTKNVIIKAKKPGISSVALAAPNFSSKEISIEVFNNNNFPTKLLMKITPEKFPIDGPRYGHIGLGLATTGGLPSFASKDTTIKLNTPNEDVIELKNSEVVINNDEYYVITEFEIIGTGDAIIFAETEGMKKISSIVNVLEATKPLKLKLYVYPENFNSYSPTTGFAIVQLIDGSGEPVLAEEDINFKISIENPNISVNTSHDFDEVILSKSNLTIEKGNYSTFTKFSPRPNLGEFTTNFEQTYNMFISAENLLTEGDSFTVLHDQIGALEGKGPSITHALPFLTSGKQEIIAVTYYETEVEVSRQNEQGVRNLVTVTVPVRANEDHQISFSSSELDTVSPTNPIMKKGENAAIVFGETGTVKGEDMLNFYITDNEGVKTITGNPIGATETEIALTVEPLIPMILAEHQFPVLAYLEDGSAVDGESESSVETSGEEVDPRIGVTPFIKNAVLTFSANEIIETDSVTIKRNQPYAMINMMSNEVGSTSLEYQMNNFEGDTTIESHTTDPAIIHLAFPKNILANSKTLATIQLLDSVGNPVYAKNDRHIKLVSNDEQILKIPQELTITKGDYFSTIELETFDDGEIEIALLSEDFALSKHVINVVDISPVLSLDLLGSLNWNERIEAKLSVSIPEITTSLDGFNVKWDVMGGEVLQFDEITDSNGVAIMNVIANDKDTVSISATISGNGLSSSSLSKTAQILNMPVVETPVENTEEPTSEFGLTMDPNTMILVTIPVAIGGALFMLKRMDKLDMITEKIPIAEKINIGDKIEEIKEKISDIRNR